MMTGAEARTYRQNLGLTARQLGQVVGVSEACVYRYEWRDGDAVPVMYEYALLHVVTSIALARGWSTAP